MWNPVSHGQKDKAGLFYKPVMERRLTEKHNQNIKMEK